MSAPKRDNYRFSFLLKLACPELPSSEFAATIAEASSGVAMLFAQGEHTAWLHLAIDPLGKPLSRKFFSEKTCRGAKLLSSVGFSAIETPLAQIDLALKQLAGEPTVSGLNELAATWLSQSRANAAIAADVACHADPKDTLLQQLKRDFLGLLATQEPCPTAAEFMNSFFEAGNADAYIAVSSNLPVFATLRDNFVTHTRATRKEKPMRESLQEYCETHPLPDSVPSASAVTTRAGYRALVEAMARTFVLRQEAKKRAIWFYGAPNSGKTRITSFLSQIFVTQALELAEGKYTLDSSEHRVATQLVLLDEANFQDLFKPSNLSNTKLFFEGRGYLRRVMMQTPRKAYAGACVFLTSNSLPAISKPSEDPTDPGYDWTAIRTRTSFFRMDVTHPGKAKFPFDATILAHAILETATQHEPSLTQSSQLEPLEEEKAQGSQGTQRDLPPVPVFASEDPALSELLGEFSPTPVAVG
jgi:hypothetical protein